jgi:hypothetical protein
MKTKKILMGILTVALIFGIMVVGCDDTSEPELPPPGSGDNSITNVNGASEYLNSLPDNTKETSVNLTLKFDLGVMTETDSVWQQLLDILNTTGKFVNLDLSACTMTGTSFNPDTSVATGKEYIVSIILPTVATSIEAGTNNANFTFKNFTNLKSISGVNILTIGARAFRNDSSTTDGNQSLQNVNFPQTTSIGNNAFAYCTDLQSLDFPEVTTINSQAFWNCSALQSLNIPKITNIGYNAFTGTGNRSLSITMGTTAPTLSYRIFANISSAKTVMVKVPSGATGYSPFTGTSVTVSGTTATANWANGLRGGGWTGSTWDSNSNGGTGGINQYIRMIIGQTSFPSGFEGIWKRDDFNNTLTFSPTTLKASNQTSIWVLTDISDDSYTISNSGTTGRPITIKLISSNLEISGDSSTDENNWNGTWRRQ